MRVLRGDPLRWGPLRPHGAAITIGVFDGVHRGHRKVIEELIARADAERLDTVALTFDRHPLEVVAPDKAPPLLTSVEDRLRLFEQLGVDIPGVLPFDEVRSMEAEWFVEGVLVRALGARLVAVGTDFRFGHDRRGDAGLLMRIGERFGFELDEVPLLAEGDGPMSSSRIRAMVETGDVAAACEALGRPFALSGVVVPGDGRGRSIGIPDRKPGDRRAAGAPRNRGLRRHRRRPRHHLQGSGQRRSPPTFRGRSAHRGGPSARPPAPI